jgi:hypothetical protein
MRKLTLLSLILGTLLVAGCGGGEASSGEDASTPLDNALGYLPSDAPFAVAIDTDTEGDQYSAANDVIERFPFSEGIKDQVKNSIEDRAGDIERLQKALGNEFVIGSTDARSFVNVPSGEDQAFVGAIQASSRDDLDELLRDEKLEEDGESNGAKLYKDDSGDAFAIDEDVLVVAGSRGQLEAALAVRDGDERLTEEDFEAGTAGVPRDALLRVYLDIGALLRTNDDARDALESKWVQAVRTAAIALSFESDEVAIDIDVKTDPEGLTDADLPIAPGAGAPKVLDRAGEVGLALRDPSQLLEFAQTTAKSVDPNGFSSFEAAKAQIERRLKVDVDDDLLAQLEGNLSVSIALDGKFGARAELEDPAAFERTLAKVAEILPSLVEGATGESVGFVEPKAGEDLYAISTADGDRIAFGVIDGVFVLANDAEIAGSLAADRSRTVPGAEGALALDADAEQLAKPLLDQITGQIAGRTGFDVGKQILGAVATRPLDRLTGSIESSTDGLSGSFRLTLDPRR